MRWKKMKLKIQNKNKYSIGFKGRYYPKLSQKTVIGTIETLNDFLTKEDLTIAAVEDINYTLNLTDLQKIAKINGVVYSGLTKEELKRALKEGANSKEEGDE